MASLSPLDQSPKNSPPPNPNFPPRSSQQHINKFLRSSSTKEASFSEFPYTPPRRSSPTSLSHSLHASPVSSPLHPLSPPPSKHPPISPGGAGGGGDGLHAAAYRCVSSVLKKDGQILSIAASNGLVYTGSEVNVVRVWKLPEFSECGQLKTKASMVVALQVSHDRVYATYGDGKIRVWQRTWEEGLRHVRIATIPRPGNYVRSYISGKDKMTKHMGAITSLAINVSEDILYSASVDKTVKVWRISDLKCVETIRAHPEPVNALIVADDGVLFTASDDATVKVWRRNSTFAACRAGAGAGAGADHHHPHSLTVTLPAKYSPVKALALTPDGAVLYAGCTDGYVHYWLKGWYSGQLSYGGALQGHTHAVMCLATATNAFLVSGSADSTCRVWARVDPDGGAGHACLAVLAGHRGPVRCVAAFPARPGGVGAGEDAPGTEPEGGCTVCSGSLDGVIKVWRVTCVGGGVGGASDRGSGAPSGCEYFEL